MHCVIPITHLLMCSYTVTDLGAIYWIHVYKKYKDVYHKLSWFVTTSMWSLNMLSNCRLTTQLPRITYVCCAVNVPLPLTDTVQLPVNGPCKSRYLAINVICTTVLSLNIQLYNCIAVFPRLHPNTTYMPNTDDTDYTDNRVVFIIWTDNVNAICTTTISSDIQLWYCIAVFPRLYPSNTYLPNTDYTDYTDNRVVFIIWTDNVNAPLTYHCR